MGRFNDKIVTIRFNPREFAILEKVVVVRSEYYNETVSYVVKKILKEEYERLADEGRI